MEIVKALTPPQKTVGSSAQIMILSWPTKLLIKTDGPGAETYLHDGPPQGKTWELSVWVNLVETDV